MQPATVSMQLEWTGLVLDWCKKASQSRDSALCGWDEDQCAEYSALSMLHFFKCVRLPSDFNHQNITDCFSEKVMFCST